MNAEQISRFNFLGVFFSLIFLLVMGRLTQVQVGPEAESFRQRAKERSGTWEEVEPIRGRIFDRSGHLLAGNQIVYEVGLDLPQVKNPETIALATSVILDVDYDTVLELAQLKGLYVKIADFVSQEKVDELEKYAEEIDAIYQDRRSRSDEQVPSLAGLEFRKTLIRTYPEGDLASNVLGFVNLERKGYYGVEGYFDGLLSGEKKTEWFPIDPDLAPELPTKRDGADLVLTIDREIQASVEEILEQSLAFNGAAGGTIVVMHPQTGEILAMATSPRVDPNNLETYGEFEATGRPFNMAIGVYEPGSVFKVLTMAAALDSGAVTPETEYIDTGSIIVGGREIRNWNQGAWGLQNMQGCLQHSLNVCLAWIAVQMGPETFYRYLQDFGIGRPTGIELEGEGSGIFWLPEDTPWDESFLGANAFGQGVSVSPVQMLMAVSAIANDGTMVAPRIVRSILDQGREFDFRSQIAGQPISAETARTLSEMLATSLEGEASSALVPGYRVAGKTGTADIPTEFGYTRSDTNASFVGWGPLDDPQFIVYIWFESPQISPWGSVVAAPVFSQVVQRLVVLMNIPYDGVRQSLVVPAMAQD